MGASKLEKLKQEIEEYRKLLEAELNAAKHSDNVERIIDLSHKLDKLIVKYEQALKEGAPE